MKKFLVPSLVVVLALLIAVPSFALEVKWGGLFRARVLSQSDFAGAPTAGDGDYGYPTVDLGKPQATGANSSLGIPKGGVFYTPHNNRFDQRLRVYMDFISSENLKVVTKFETQSIWGRTNEQPNNVGAMNYGSGNVGADSGYLTVKNVYASFNIPGTPLSANVGVQGVALLDSWIVDTDVSGALLVANLKPFTVILGYVAGQNFNTRTSSDNIDDLAAVVAYKEGPFSAALVGLWQDAHNVPASVFPTVAAVYDDPLQVDVQFSPSFNGGSAYPYPYAPSLYVTAQNNNLFDLGFQLGYKIDYLSAYLNFVKNFGSTKVGLVKTATTEPTPSSVIAPFGQQTINYTGWMVDAGANYFCGPFTANIGGFYTTGQKLNIVAENPNKLISASNPQVITPNNGSSLANIDGFTYPLSTSKYFSEIIGGGILDNFAPNGGYWRGYPNPTNLWTATVGGAWQALPTTKLALSYWYFGTSSKVPSVFNANLGTWSTSSSIGSEIDLNITQNIVDKLNLDLVGAYLFEGNAYRARTEQVYSPNSKNVYELGARLQWTW
jgi:hypothetical protein